MVSLIDSHAHLDYPQLSEDLPGVLERAKQAGVEAVISIGVKLSTADKPRQIAETYDNVFFSVGIHPHEAANEPLACDTGSILALAEHPKCVAIGEAGLDYFYDHAPRALQADSFRAQIAVARTLGLPIIVHARDADDDIIDIIEEEFRKGPFKGVLHCFSSGRRLAERALDIGFYISFSGILTFKSAKELQEIATIIPDDRLLVETDSPYLAPVPHRGKSNEPAYTLHTLEKLAELRGEDLIQMAIRTKENTLSLFSKMRGNS